MIFFMKYPNGVGMKNNYRAYVAKPSNINNVEIGSILVSISAI